MAEIPIPITTGSGAASVAADVVSNNSYQQIKVVDGTLGSSTALIVNSDGTLNARISGSVATAGTSFTGSISGAVQIAGVSPSSIATVLRIDSSPIGSMQGIVTKTVLTGLQTTGTYRDVRMDDSGAMNITGGNNSVITIIQGSIAAAQSGARSTSIIGGASVFQAGPWTTSVFGSVTAMQGTNPWVITGSVQGTFAGGNSSVQLLTGSAVIGSVMALQGTNPWVITGSIQGSFSPSGNQSVSGTVGASAIGLTPVSVSNFPTTQNVSGSVVATQGTNPWIITGSVQGSFSPSGNQSVSGTVGASIIGLTPVQIPGSVAVAIISGSIAASFTPPANQSVSGTVQTDVRGSVATVIIGGSIAASFTAPPNQSVSGTVQVDVRSSVAVAIISGSIAATFTPPANQSVSGTVNIGTGGPVSVLGTMSVLGTVPVTQATTPWVITGSVQGSFSPSGNQSVSGTVGASIIGSVPVTIAGPVPSQSVSGTVGASIIGQLPAGTAVIGSVAALQGTNPWIVTSSIAGGIFPISGSVAATITNTNINVSGSVVGFQGGTQITSIAGGYAMGAASIVSGLGVLTFGVRNDTLASVLAVSDGQYTPQTIGPAGEGIVANAPLTKWIQGQSSVFGTTSQVALAKTGNSIFTYVTAVQIANLSANNVLITFAGGTASVLGFTVAPANGGSNIYFPNALKTAANQDFTASISGGIASVFISAQGFISKT